MPPSERRTTCRRYPPSRTGMLLTRWLDESHATNSPSRRVGETWSWSGSTHTSFFPKRAPHDNLASGAAFCGRGLKIARDLLSRPAREGVGSPMEIVETLTPQLGKAVLYSVEPGKWMLVSPTERRTVQTAGAGLRQTTNNTSNYKPSVEPLTNPGERHAGHLIKSRSWRRQCPRCTLRCPPPAEDDCFQGLACEVRW